MHTVQYLEGSTDWSHMSPRQVRQKLMDAGSIVSFRRVLVGWNLPLELLDACRQACDTLGASMFLWHPLLTGDGDWQPHPSWRVVGGGGEPVASHEQKSLSK